VCTLNMEVDDLFFLLYIVVLILLRTFNLDFEGWRRDVASEKSGLVFYLPHPRKSLCPHLLFTDIPSPFLPIPFPTEMTIQED
jgi:hypothetical protein